MRNSLVFLLDARGIELRNFHQQGAAGYLHGQGLAPGESFGTRYEVIEGAVELR